MITFRRGRSPLRTFCRKGHTGRCDPVHIGNGTFGSKAQIFERRPAFRIDGNHDIDYFLMNINALNHVLFDDTLAVSRIDNTGKGFGNAFPVGRGHIAVSENWLKSVIAQNLQARIVVLQDKLSYKALGRGPINYMQHCPDQRFQTVLDAQIGHMATISKQSGM